MTAVLYSHRRLRPHHGSHLRRRSRAVHIEQHDDVCVVDWQQVQSVPRPSSPHARTQSYANADVRLDIGAAHLVVSVSDGLERGVCAAAHQIR